MSGKASYQHTINRLTRWYLSRTREHGAELTADEARAMLDLLLAHLPARSREKAMRRIVEGVAEAGQGAGVAPPEWLGELGHTKSGG